MICNINESYLTLDFFLLLLQPHAQHSIEELTLDPKLGTLELSSCHGITLATHLTSPDGFLVRNVLVSPGDT